jgi:glycosyltransferase involved in cell wall biosynthesis
MAMNVPVFITNTGLAARLLSECDAGIVVEARDYKMWNDKLKQILDGKKVKTVDREVVKSQFHWPNVAAQYIKMYRELYNSHYVG